MELPEASGYVESVTFQMEGDETTYKLPLASSMPADDLISLQEAELKGQVPGAREHLRILAKYMGEEAAMALTTAEANGILAAWLEESNKAGASQGE